MSCCVKHKDIFYLTRCRYFSSSLYIQVLWVGACLLYALSGVIRFRKAAACHYYFCPPGSFATSSSQSPTADQLFTVLAVQTSRFMHHYLPLGSCFLFICFPPSPSSQTNCIAEFWVWVFEFPATASDSASFFFSFLVHQQSCFEESKIARLWCLPTSSDLAGLSFYAAQHFLFGKPVEKCRPLTNVHVGLDWIGE